MVTWPGQRGYTPTLYEKCHGIFNDHRVTLGLTSHPKDGCINSISFMILINYTCFLINNNNLT